MKKLTCFLMISVLVLSLLSACGQDVKESTAASAAKQSSETSEEGSASEASASEESSGEESETPAWLNPEDPMAKYRTGYPWLCIDMDGVVTADMETSPKEDYGLYVNKDKILELQIQDGYNLAGPYADLNIALKEDVTALFTGERTSDSHDAKLAYTLYDLFMDWDTRNAIGMKPILEYAGQLGSIHTIEELNTLFVDTPASDQLMDLCSVYIDTDLDDSSVYMISISCTDILLEDSAEYEHPTERGEEIRELKEELIIALLKKMDYTEEQARTLIGETYAFEKLLAGSILTNDELQDPDVLDRMNNHYSMDELRKLAGNYPICDILTEAYWYEKAETVLVEEPDWLETLGEVYIDENVGIIKSWLLVHTVIEYASYLDRECEELLTEYTNALKGVHGRLSDEVSAANSVSDHLPWAVSRLYVDAYITEEDKKVVADMIADFKVAYEDIIRNADFISGETKEKSIEKLRAIRIRSLYPDDWSEYECDGLEITPKEEGGTLFDAILSLSRYTMEDTKDLYLEKVDNSVWSGTPITVNAYYSMTDNSVTVMAAFARYGLYHSGMSVEELYGGLGAGVIGHEISHAFDSIGSQFDMNGNLVDWWSDEDVYAFQEKDDRLAAYYDAMYPWEGESFIGANLTSEACADLGGMKVALSIVKNIEGFDYDVFFRTFAYYYLTKATEERCITNLDDEHPFDYLRVNVTLQHFDEFLELYDIQPGDNMYLAPEDRVNIW